jgi:segregation and condensation protein B
MVDFEDAELINANNLKAALEAILLVAENPLSVVNLATALERPAAEVKSAIESLAAEYDEANGGEGRGFELREIGGGWRFYVRETFDWAVRLFIARENPAKLSQAALETLAVIAYRQPITRGQIASIRAVNVDGVVRTLLSRGLITEVYSDQETGAVHFGTTELMLQQLGINSIEELPKISPLLPDNNDDLNAL